MTELHLHRQRAKRGPEDKITVAARHDVLVSTVERGAEIAGLIMQEGAWVSLAVLVFAACGKQEWPARLKPGTSGTNRADWDRVLEDKPRLWDVREALVSMLSFFISWSVLVLPGRATTMLEALKVALLGGEMPEGVPDVAVVWNPFFPVLQMMFTSTGGLLKGKLALTRDPFCDELARTWMGSPDGLVAAMAVCRAEHPDRWQLGSDVWPAVPMEIRIWMALAFPWVLRFIIEHTPDFIKALAELLKGIGEIVPG